MSGYADDSANNHTAHGPNSPILVTNYFAYKVSNPGVNPIRGAIVPTVTPKLKDEEKPWYQQQTES